jgi:hypothetical protein
MSVHTGGILMMSEGQENSLVRCQGVLLEDVNVVNAV